MSGGGSRVTLSSLASIDEDASSDQQVQQRLNIILKVRREGWRGGGGGGGGDVFMQPALSAAA